jgi:hypothetical protein
MKMAVFWEVVPCSLVETDRRFRGPHSLRPDGRRGKHLHWSNITEQLTTNEIPQLEGSGAVISSVSHSPATLLCRHLAADTTARWKDGLFFTMQI